MMESPPGRASVLRRLLLYAAMRPAGTRTSTASSLLRALAFQVWFLLALGIQATPARASAGETADGARLPACSGPARMDAAGARTRPGRAGVEGPPSDRRPHDSGAGGAVVLPSPVAVEGFDEDRGPAHSAPAPEARIAAQDTPEGTTEEPPEGEDAHHHEGGGEEGSLVPS